MEIEVGRLVRLNVVFHHLNQEAESQLGLSLVQYHLLSALKDMPGCSPQDLAQELGMHPSTVTQSLKRLDRKKTVFIAANPRDAPKKFLSLTRKGRDSLVRFRQGINQVMRPGSD